MADYTGKSETEHLIEQAARELQISPITIAASLEHPATYSVKFKDKRGDEGEIFVPFQAGYKSILDAMKFVFRGKKS